MLITDEEREQVVELLRCAADIVVTGKTRWAPTFIAAEWLDCTLTSVDEAADRVVEIVRVERRAPKRGRTTTAPRMLKIILEAAQRVEEGSWP